MKNQHLSSEGPSAAEALVAENAEPQTKVAALIEEVRGLNVEVKDLTKKPLNAHTTKSDRMDMFLKSLSPKPLSTYAPYFYWNLCQFFFLDSCGFLGSRSLC